MEIFKLFGSIFIDNDEANKSIAKTGKESDGLVKKMGKGIKTAGKWAAGIAAAATGIGIAAFAMTKKVTGAFDDIAKNSRKMGVSTDYYQEMEYWASQNGLSHENMEKSMKRLNQRLGQAVAGNKKYSDALTTLGVDLKEVEKGNISTEQAMTQSIQALSEMENSQEKAALAAELFGVKLAQELMPAIDGGALSIEDAQKKAEELGIVIAEDTLNAAEDFNDTWDDLSRSFTAFGQKIFAELMPAFQTMMDWVMEHMPQIQAVFSFVFGIISDSVSAVIGWIGSLISWLSEWYQNNEETLTMIWEIIQEIFTNVVEFLQETWEFIKGLWDEYGADLVDAITDAFNAIWGIIEKIMPIIQDIIGTAFDTIKNTIENAIEFVMGIIDVFTGILTLDFSKLKDGLLRIWRSLWSGIKDLVSGAWNILKGAFGGLLSKITNWFTSLPGKALGWGKSFMNGFKDGIKAVGDTLKSVIKAPINGIIKIVNGMINGLNKISIKLPKIPSWVPGLGGKGGGTLGFNIPNIPSLATGGVVHDPTLAMIGDAGAGNPEIVTPEKLMRKIVEESLKDRVNTTKQPNESLITRLLEKILQAIKEGKNIVINDEVLLSVVNNGLVTDADLDAYFRGDR